MEVAMGNGVQEAQRAAEEADGFLKAAEGAVLRLQQSIAALKNGDLGTEAHAKRARIWARALAAMAEEIETSLTPKCHECGKTVAFGVRCCSECWHTSTEDGRCDLEVAHAAE